VYLTPPKSTVRKSPKPRPAIPARAFAEVIRSTWTGVVACTITDFDPIPPAPVHARL
jgi:hypothetical protein